MVDNQPTPVHSIALMLLALPATTHWTLKTEKQVVTGNSLCEHPAV